MDRIDDLTIAVLPSRTIIGRLDSSLEDFKRMSGCLELTEDIFQMANPQGGLLAQRVHDCFPILMMGGPVTVRVPPGIALIECSELDEADKEYLGKLVAVGRAREERARRDRSPIEHGAGIVLPKH